MSLKLRGLLAVCIGLVLGLCLTVGPVVQADRAPAVEEDLPWQEARLLAEVLERVKRDYVEAVDDHELIEAAIRGMVADLDPHSAFLAPDEFQEIRISTSGNYMGIGLEVSVENDQVVVVTPMDGSPAANAGVQPGDIVLSIDGMPVDPRDLDDTVARMRGRPGTPVVLGIRRPGVETPMSFELARERIEVHSVRSELLESGYGYVRISHFSETTAQDLARVVGELSAQAGEPLRGLVLDLRNNPGGVLEAAVAVADAFLDGGLIVTADGRMPEARFRIEATAGDLLDGAPVTVLVNGGSASASEIVAGALRDQERATVVGTVTFGKGSVQTVMPLSEGRAIKLTTSRYYTPSGQSIHGRGIQPDVTVEPGVEESADPQLAAALKTLKTLRVVQRAP